MAQRLLRTILSVALVTACVPAPTTPGAATSPTTPAITPADLKTRLYIFADDSMQGREAGTQGNVRGTDYIAAEARRIGLEPAGENSSFLQTVPTLSRTAAPVRNVVAVLPGSDPRLRGEYVALGAHSDHLGVRHGAVDHDSLRLLNAVARPEGDNRPARPVTPLQRALIQQQLDSLRRIRAPRPDSIFNGADDDGSGSVTLLEIAEALAQSQEKPRRSILFVWHSAEEQGLYGSRWFTDHPTVPRDSIVAQLNMDMVGRGSPSDVEGGGPYAVGVVGSRRLSTELGDLIEQVNRRRQTPFIIDYRWDANGHPDNIYCRSDHYMYARYGIPIAFFSTGLHRDYHEVTDEPQYIDYEHMARVGGLVRDVAVAVANLDHRPVVDHQKPDPRAPCQQ